MSVDLSQPLKGEVVMHLASDASILQMVPAERVFGMSTPALVAWPFIRYGSPIVAPYEASCWPGSRVRATLHAFAETSQTESGDDVTGRLASRIVESMKRFSPSGMGLVMCDWLGTRLIREDAEADRWHGVVEFDIIVVTQN